MQPTISVIIPAYNPTEHFEKAIESALNQSIKPFEIIVINDGKSGTPASKIEQYLQHPHVVYLKQDKPSITSKTYNDGINKAQGKWVAILDGDDIWHPEKLKMQAKLINDKAGFIFCDRKFFYTDPKINTEPIRYKAEFCINPLETLLKSFFAPPSTALIRKSALVKAGLFDEAFATSQDYDLWLRISSKTAYTFHYVPQSLVLKRKHSLSITDLQEKKEWVDDLINAFIKNKQVICEKGHLSDQDFLTYVGRSYGYLAKKFLIEHNYSTFIYCFLSAFRLHKTVGHNAIKRFLWKYSESPYYD